MTIDQLEAICKAARQQGLYGSHEVKLYHDFTIFPIVDFQCRKVQVYDSDGRDWRNKYLLLASVNVGGLSSK